MSTLEKRIYKEVVVPAKQRTQTLASPATYKGMSTVNPDNTTYKLYDLALVKQDIINNFHIRQGEKLSNPEYGTIIWDILFDPLTDDLKEAVANNVTKIVNSDPRVQADSIIIEEYEQGLQIEITLTYLNFNLTETMQLKFDKDAGFVSG